MSSDAVCETNAANGKGMRRDTAFRLRQLADDLSRSSIPYDWHLSARLNGILEWSPRNQPQVIARVLSPTDMMWFRRQAHLYDSLLQSLEWEHFAFAQDLAQLLKAMAREAREAEYLLRDLLSIADTAEAA